MPMTMLNKRKRRPTHPGEILREDILPAAGLSQTALAHRLGVSRRTVNALLREQRGVTPDMAHRLARVFHTTPEVWLNLQQAVDIWNAFIEKKHQYEQLKPLKVA